MLEEKSYGTRCGKINYWVSKEGNSNLTLVFLPGLSMGHKMFVKQFDYFEGKYNILTWDAPANASSYPFNLNFTLQDKAIWLDEILTKEELPNPIIIGHSMGGYVGQAYTENFPQKLKGFISLSSFPLQKKYCSRFELFYNKWLSGPLMYLTKWMSWESIVNSGIENIAYTEEGKQANESDFSYEFKCPVLLTYGDKDKSYNITSKNKSWSEDNNFKLEIIEEAGHLSPSDKPEKINSLIENFVQTSKI
ncbi:hypothetical protein PIROE2DRAFT_12918 [Piromyces sp. E2]|nr:hypothetical protein PIROE2DRAFT_12918 [Piromyces sp. E2]|eukprot:OUM61158.1 hypothetical protein PIROE2DRAFT_12918 [Piromyces sp. E2]